MSKTKTLIAVAFAVVLGSAGSVAVAGAAKEETPSCCHKQAGQEESKDLTCSLTDKKVDECCCKQQDDGKLYCTLAEQTVETCCCKPSDDEE